jgi:hypothetical protein
MMDLISVLFGMIGPSLAERSYVQIVLRYRHGGLGCKRQSRQSVNEGKTPVLSSWTIAMKSLVLPGTILLLSTVLFCRFPQNPKTAEAGQSAYAGMRMSVGDCETTSLPPTPDATRPVR